MEYKIHTKKLGVLSFIFFLLGGIHFSHQIFANLTPPITTDILIATPYSPVIVSDESINSHTTLAQKAIEKHKKFRKHNPLVLLNSTSGVIYTFLNGIIPPNNLLFDEIDLLKIFGYSNLRDKFMKLVDDEKNKKISKKELADLKKSYEDYLKKMDEYITFFKERFDGINQQNIKELYRKFNNSKIKISSGGPRIHIQDLVSHFEQMRTLRLSQNANSPFYSLEELFHSEMLLFYAIEKGIKIDDFNFEVFKQQNPLNFCLYKDMCLPGEILFARFSNTTERVDKKLIISSLQPSMYPTRYIHAQFPRYTLLPNFIKIALDEKTPTLYKKK
jgi:hypothetical protein